MQLHLACIGRLKSSPEKELVSDYAARIEQLGKRAGLRRLVMHENLESTLPQAPERMADEASRLLDSIPAGSVIVALDERGEQVSSQAFAGLISGFAGTGTPHLAFILGGPDGLAPEIRKLSRKSLAMGAMTWPHRLARVMLLEQIYRAITIMLNHPYHRP